RQNGPRSADRRDTRSSRSNRPESVAVLFLSEPPETGGTRDTPTGAGRAPRDEGDNPPPVPHRGPPPGAGPGAPPGAPRPYELKFAGKRHSFHRLAKMLSIRVM